MKDSEFESLKKQQKYKIGDNLGDGTYIIRREKGIFKSVFSVRKEKVKKIIWSLKLFFLYIPFRGELPSHWKPSR